MRALLSRLPVRAVGRKIAGRSHRRGADRYARGSMSDGPRLPAPTWFVGCGNMGGAMVDGWRVGGRRLVVGARVIRPSGTPVEGVRTVTASPRRARRRSWSCSRFKPQKLDEIAPQLRTWLTSKTVVVSILAGVEAASLRERFPGRAAIVRAMPNLPVAIRRGVVAPLQRRMPTSRREAASLRPVRAARLRDVGGRRGEACRNRLGRRRRPCLCRAVHRGARQGRAEARA